MVILGRTRKAFRFSGRSFRALSKRYVLGKAGRFLEMDGSSPRVAAARRILIYLNRKGGQSSDRMRAKTPFGNILGRRQITFLSKIVLIFFGELFIPGIAVQVQGPVKAGNTVSSERIRLSSASLARAPTK